jgi:hypothetical protein
MVLAELGGRISRALQQMSNATFIDEKVLAECLNEISRALLQADMQFKTAMNMQNNIKKIVNLDDLAAGHNKRKIIQQVREFPPPSLPRHPSVPPPLSLATSLQWDLPNLDIHTDRQTDIQTDRCAPNPKWLHNIPGL